MPSPGPIDARLVAVPRFRSKMREPDQRADQAEGRKQLAEQQYHLARALALGDLPTDLAQQRRFELLGVASFGRERDGGAEKRIGRLLTRHRSSAGEPSTR